MALWSLYRTKHEAGNLHSRRPLPLLHGTPIQHISPAHSARCSGHVFWVRVFAAFSGLATIPAVLLGGVEGNLTSTALVGGA